MKNVKLYTTTRSFNSSSQNQTSSQTQTTIASTIQHYINSHTPNHGQKIHTQIIKSGFQPDTNISIKLLILHLKSQSLKYARKVFDELPNPTLSAYNYMISGYLKHGHITQSLCMVRGMVYSGLKPDGFTLSMVLKASTRNGGSDVRMLGRGVHAWILKFDVDSDDVLYTALVDSYVKSGRMDCGRTVFDLMIGSNVVCSTSMISGYMNRGDIDDAEDVYRKTVEKDVVVYNAMIEGYSKKLETSMKSIEVYIDMQRSDFRPNMSTFASVIGACSVSTAYEIGQQIHCQLMKTSFFTDIKMGSSLLDMYAKCGRIDDARTVFDHMFEKNVVSWTSMIDGYGKNGNPNEALVLFEAMREFNVEPNHVTFLGALSACGHSGLVDKGVEIFESMKKDYGMKPKMEHYACVVDMYGRAGRLKEAWGFVMRMPEKPGCDVWAALLSSCVLYGETEMARVASDELFRLNSDRRPGAYMALSNTFAAAGKWENVSEVRERMKVRGVLKSTACSWIGSDGGGGPGGGGGA